LKSIVSKPPDFIKQVYHVNQTIKMIKNVNNLAENIQNKLIYTIASGIIKM